MTPGQWADFQQSREAGRIPPEPGARRDLSDGAERFHAKRAAGIPATRPDGWTATPENDRQSAAAERYACNRFGAVYNDEVYADHGDGGCDFRVGELTVDVVWAGYESGTRRPRLVGHLIIDPGQPHRHADLYLSVAGSIEAGFTLVGWARHADLARHPLRDFGYGPRWAVPFDSLRLFRWARVE